MKRVLGMLMAMVMLLLANMAGALAEETSLLVPEQLSKLKSKTLIQVVEKEIGKGWTLYQPNEAEEDENLSSAANLKKMHFFPVIAQKGNQLRLLVLQKQNGKWHVTAQNDRALIRKGWKLEGFYTSNYAGADSAYIFFEFRDENQTRWQLELSLSFVYESKFDLIRPVPELLYDNVGEAITISYNHIFTFQFYSPFYFQCNYEVNSVKDYQFGLENFELATCPLSMREFLVPAVVSCGEEGAGLYIMAQENVQPILYLADGEAIEAIPQRWSREWTIVYYRGNYLFIKTENCKMEK